MNSSIPENKDATIGGVGNEDAESSLWENQHRGRMEEEEIAELHQNLNIKGAKIKVVGTCIQTNTGWNAKYGFANKSDWGKTKKKTKKGWFGTVQGDSTLSRHNLATVITV